MKRGLLIFHFLTGVCILWQTAAWAGQAPAAGCTRADVGKEVRVKYQATYLFYDDKR